MSRKADAIELMKRVMSGESYLNYKEIAKITGYHEKYLLKLKKELEAGTISLVHGNTNRKPKNTISDETKNKILELRRSYEYEISNFKHFQELLKERESINISYSAL